MTCFSPEECKQQVVRSEYYAYFDWLKSHLCPHHSTGGDT